MDILANGQTKVPKHEITIETGFYNTSSDLVEANKTFPNIYLMIFKLS